MGKNKEAAKEMIRVSGARSVPVIVIGTDVIVGFKASQIDAALVKEN